MTTVPTITVAKNGDWWIATPSFLLPGSVQITGCESRTSAEDAERLLRKMLSVGMDDYAEDPQMELGI